MSKIEAVVLCGGLGSRLRPLTYYFQKTMLPIGTAQRPILEYILKVLHSNGIGTAVLLASYKYEQIQNYFGDGSNLGMKLTYVKDDPRMPGSGGALLNAEGKGAFSGCDTLLIYYGDILTKLNVRGLLDSHVKDGAEATLALATSFRLSVGVAKLKGRNISSFLEKPTIPINVGVGVMALQTSALGTLRVMSRKNAVDIMGDLLPELIRRKKKVEGYRFDEFWLDIGSIETYEKLDHEHLDEVFADMLHSKVRAR